MGLFSAQYGFIRSLFIYQWIPGRKKRLTDFYQQFIKPHDLCFDLGSHIGSRAEIWSRIGAKTIAIEPQNKFYNYLRQRFKGRNNVEILHLAIGSYNGFVDLLVSDKTPTVSTVDQRWIDSVIQDVRFEDIEWNRTERVPIAKLDSLIESYGIPKFCKIDVEGYEEQVLDGLSYKIPILSFEYIPITRNRAIACIHKLEKMGCYHYNWSETESMSFQSDFWLSSNQMIDQLMRLDTYDKSGDIYAKLSDFDETQHIEGFNIAHPTSGSPVLPR